MKPTTKARILGGAVILLFLYASEVYKFGKFWPIAAVIFAFLFEYIIIKNMRDGQDGDAERADAGSNTSRVAGVALVASASALAAAAMYISTSPPDNYDDCVARAATMPTDTGVRSEQARCLKVFVEGPREAQRQAEQKEKKEKWDKLRLRLGNIYLSDVNDSLGAEGKMLDGDDLCQSTGNRCTGYYWMSGDAFFQAYVLYADSKSGLVDKMFEDQVEVNEHEIFGPTGLRR